MREHGRQSALAGYLLPGRHGVDVEPPGILVSEVCPGAMAQLSGPKAPDALIAALRDAGMDDGYAPGRCVQGQGVRALWNGPGQCLVVSSQSREEALCAQLAATLSGSAAAVIDVSHARTVLRVEGPACRDVLAKGCPLDVDAMVPGECAPTVVSHFNVLVHCAAPDAFELYVTRSFALAFYQWLLAAGAEFGVQIRA